METDYHRTSMLDLTIIRKCATALALNVLSGQMSMHVWHSGFCRALHMKGLLMFCKCILGAHTMQIW